MSTPIKSAPKSTDSHITPLTGNLGLSIQMSLVAGEPRPFIIPTTPEGKSAILSLATVNHHLRNWSSHLYRKIEVLAAGPSLRLYLGDKQNYQEWLQEVHALAKNLESLPKKGKKQPEKSESGMEIQQG